MHYGRSVSKEAIGKIDINASAEMIEDACKNLGITIYPLKASYIDYMRNLPPIHKDPFDRIMIAQAICENQVFVTRDSIIPSYPDIKVAW